MSEPTWADVINEYGVCCGSGEKSDRVHPSGAIMCPACNAGLFSSGFTVPYHHTLFERPLPEPR